MRHPRRHSTCKFTKKESEPNMKNKISKPKMSSDQLIYQKCVEKGITFKYISQEKAISYIQEKNNFLRIMSYRKNYRKHEVGKGNPEHYINLDFAYLYELSIIDMHLRNIILKMCSDIEHSLKVSLVTAIEKDDNQDGYTIVEDYIDGLTDVCRRSFLGGLARKSSSSYTGVLIKKNFSIKTLQRGKAIAVAEYDDCPAWVFVELLSFGEFIDFYKYCVSFNIVEEMDGRVLNQVRSLRNGCAHNDCLIVDFTSKADVFAPREIVNEVLRITSISKKQRTKKLKNRFLTEFTSLLYIYQKVVKGPMKKHHTSELKEFLFVRAVEKKEFF